MPTVHFHIHFQTAYSVKDSKDCFQELHLLASARGAGSPACMVATKLHARCPEELALWGTLGYGSDSEEIRPSYSSLERSSCVFNMKHFIR